MKLSLIAVMSISLFGTCLSNLASAGQAAQATIHSQLAQLESSSHGRLGIAAINTGNEQQIKYRANERFPFCSTSKVMGVAAILKRSMVEQNFLNKKINYTQKDIDASHYAPETKKHVAEGMTISALSQAAITQSDNTAINLLMKELGGPQAVTAFARSIGDNTFRLDRWEPALNTSIPGDQRDTTTPEAMANSLQKLVLGDVLGQSQREQLQTWLKNNTTGDKRIRAGVLKGWIVGDKTGTGDYGTSNDVAVIWPPKCKPIILVTYFTQKQKDAKPNDQVLASATRIVINDLVQKDQCLK